MRARNIKPSFFDNENLAELEPLARLLFIGLWCLADREGRLEDRPARIGKQLLAYDRCDVDALLDQLANAKEKFIVRYEVDGKRYIQITNFKKHQRPHPKEAASEIPPPPGEIEEKHGKELLSREKVITSREKVMSSREKELSSPSESPFPFPSTSMPSPDKPGNGVAAVAEAVEMPVEPEDTETKQALDKLVRQYNQLSPPTRKQLAQISTVRREQLRAALIGGATEEILAQVIGEIGARAAPWEIREEACKRAAAKRATSLPAARADPDFERKRRAMIEQYQREGGP